MRKDDLINLVWEKYGDSNDYLTVLEKITGSTEADILSDAVFNACKKMTIPELKELLKELDEGV